MQAATALRLKEYAAPFAYSRPVEDFPVSFVRFGEFFGRSNIQGYYSLVLFRQNVNPVAAACISTIGYHTVRMVKFFTVHWSGK
jgi:hypothetical protein